MQALNWESQNEVPPRPWQMAFQLEQLAADAASAETMARMAVIAATNESLFIFPP
jgi:hypothetical protein